jgi:hypothetical protein
MEHRDEGHVRSAGAVPRAGSAPNMTLHISAFTPGTAFQVSDRLASREGQPWDPTGNKTSCGCLGRGGAWQI